jgi:hypothetical protein
MSDSERVRISVNNAGKVRAKRTTFVAQRNQLSAEDVKTLTNKKPAVCGLLRLRHHPSQRPCSSDLTKQELNLYLDGRGASLKRVHKKTSSGRDALARNLALQRGTGDRYMLRSHLEGPDFNSGLYAAADDDSKLEEAVHNVSKTAFNADAGVMRMPLEKPGARFSQPGPTPQTSSSEFDSDAKGYRFYAGDRCYDVTSATKSGQHKINDSTIKRDQFQHVTQETYRAQTKRSAINMSRPTGPGVYSTRYESLRPTPSGSHLTHEDLSIYSEYSKCR